MARRARPRPLADLLSRGDEAPSKRPPGSLPLTFFLGVDLGQPSEPTAIVVVESDTLLQVGHAQASGPGWSASVPLFLTRDGQKTTEHPPVSYALRHIERLVGGVSYAEVVERVLALRAELPQAKISVDTTGVGLAVVELFRKALPSAVLVNLVLGGVASSERGIKKVPKRDFVAVAQVLLQNGRLKIAKGLMHGELLAKELLSFRSRVDVRSSPEPVEAWREGASDDLVFAVSAAVWLAERDSGIPAATWSLSYRHLSGRPGGAHTPSPWDLIRTNRLPGRP